MKREVNLHIGELVLHGFAPGDGGRIALAVRRELARRFRQSGIPESAGNPSTLASLDAGTIHIPAGAAPRMTGTRIGASIHRGFERQGQPRQSARLAKPAPGGHPR